MKEVFGSTQPPVFDLNEELIKELAGQQVNQRLAIPGVQRKLSVGFSNNKQEKSRLTIVGFLGGEYIVKPPAKEYPYMVEIEDLTMNLAIIVGIVTAVHTLIPFKDEFAYLIKRFDRHKKNKLACEDLCQLSNKQTSQKYRGSSEKAGKTIAKYSSYPGDDCLRFFELILFSFVTGNADMHLKNFTLLTEDEIRLSPAYDLLSTRLLLSKHVDAEEVALPINGKKQNIKAKDFYVFAESLSINHKVIDNIIVNYFKKVKVMHDLIDMSFLSKALREQYKELIDERLKTFK